MAQSPWHYGHLDPCRHGLGEQLRASDFSDAARRLRAWIQDGVLRHDPDPSYYLVEERFEADGVLHRRISITGALRLHAYAEGIVLRHERTLDGPKEDRLMLRRATRAQLSPIFLLFHDAHATLQRLHSEVSSLAPEVEVTTADGVTHALWVLSSPGHVQSLRGMVQDQSLWIADGHHRYETALAHQRESRAATATHGEQSTDFQLATLCAMSDPGLILRPFHRWITFPAAVDQSTFVDALRNHPSTDLLGGTVEQWTARLGEAHAQGPALVIVATVAKTTHAWLVRAPVKGTPWVGEPAALRWLHDELLPAAGLPLNDQARGHRIRYSPELRDVLRWSADEEVPSVAVLVPTYAVNAIAEACKDGEPLPQKSTFFAPKPASGLIMLDLELPPPS